MVWREGMPQWTLATAVPGLMPEAAPRRQRYAEPEEDDRRAPDRRGRDRRDDRDRQYDDEPEEGVRRRPRRRPEGMSTGAKVAIWLGIGGGVLLLIIVVIVVIVVVANSSAPNVRTFNIPPGGTQGYDVTFKAGVRTVVTVTSDKNTDIDLFVFAPNNRFQPIAADVRIHKDCRVEFVPPVTGVYRVEVRNINLGALLPVGPNRCTLRWDPP